MSLRIEMRCPDCGKTWPGIPGDLCLTCGVEADPVDKQKAQTFWVDSEAALDDSWQRAQRRRGR
jgi:hypothetical protein